MISPLIPFQFGGETNQIRIVRGSLWDQLSWAASARLIGTLGTGPKAGTALGRSAQLTSLLSMQ